MGSKKKSQANQKIVIRISRQEVRQRPRSEIKKTLPHRDQTKYTRKLKHKKDQSSH